MIREVLRMGDPRLWQKSAPVAAFGRQLLTVPLAGSSADGELSTEASTALSPTVRSLAGLPKYPREAASMP